MSLRSDITEPEATDPFVERLGKFDKRLEAHWSRPALQDPPAEGFRILVVGCAATQSATFVGVIANGVPSWEVVVASHWSERLPMPTDLTRRDLDPLISGRSLDEDWRGIVDDVLEDRFVARVTDRMGRREDLEVEFEVTDVAPGSRHRIQPGAVFRWVVYFDDDYLHSRRSIIAFEDPLPPSDPYSEEAKRFAYDSASLFD